LNLRGTAGLRPFAAVIAVALSAALCGAAVVSGAAALLPSPCDAVPGNLVAKALGLKKPPQATLTTVAGIETCSYKGIKLTVAVGTTAIQSSATPKTIARVSGLPHGRYTTYTGSKQSQILFSTGSGADAVFAVIRNYGTIRRSKLERFARALYAAMAGASGSGAPSGPTLVGN
jgi:hypothetical protein